MDACLKVFEAHFRFFGPSPGAFGGLGGGGRLIAGFLVFTGSEG